MQSWCRRAVLAATLGLAACSEPPTAPPDGPDADRPDLSIITPVILPAGSGLGALFPELQPDQIADCPGDSLSGRLVTGSGIFAIPLVGTGYPPGLRGHSLRQLHSSGESLGTVTNIPESAVATGTARFLSGPRAGQQVPFTLDLHSTFFPDQTSVFDRATLRFCSASSSCSSYSFFGSRTTSRSDPGAAVGAPEV